MAVDGRGYAIILAGRPNNLLVCPESCRLLAGDSPPTPVLRRDPVPLAACHRVQSPMSTPVKSFDQPQSER